MRRLQLLHRQGETSFVLLILTLKATLYHLLVDSLVDALAHPASLSSILTWRLNIEFQSHNSPKEEYLHNLKNMNITEINSGKNDKYAGIRKAGVCFMS